MCPTGDLENLLLIQPIVFFLHLTVPEFKPRSNYSFMVHYNLLTVFSYYSTVIT